MPQKKKKKQNITDQLKLKSWYQIKLINIEILFIFHMNSKKKKTYTFSEM